MSSSAAGKFQDHYIVLGVDPLADLETIRAAYAKLADKYAGEPAKLDNVNQAYEVLCDPELRASFDKVKGVDHEAGSPKFTGVEFFDALAKSAGLRAAILCILYDRRRVKSFKPSLSMRNLDGMLHVTGEALNFALWYLKKRALVVYDDKSAMEITVDGMDFLEQNRPSPEVVMEFIKPDALGSTVPAARVTKGKAPAPVPVPVQAPAEEVALTETTIAEPVLNVLGRALTRNIPEPPRKVTLEFK